MESGRTAISKGLLDKAKQIASTNVARLGRLVARDCPVVGIEPSALLTLRDEYPDLVPAGQVDAANRLARYSLTIDEFLDKRCRAGDFDSSMFHKQKRHIRLHGHCHQKSLSSLAPTIRLLQLPGKYRVKLIPAGCCGMAGSFGYERDHYELSMKIGELVLFPAIRKLPAETIVAAPGTSCRQQIRDGTGVTALHPVEILRQALIG